MRSAHSKTSRKRKYLRLHKPFSSSELKNPRLVSETLLECIQTGDLDSFRDVLCAFILTSNKFQLAKKAGIGRRTLYDLLDPKQTFNPELSTVSALIRALTEVRSPRKRTELRRTPV